MSIKDLFRKDLSSSKVLAGTTLVSASAEVESADQLRENLVRKERFVPHVDYSNPANFAKFGLAKIYYEDSVDRIRDRYPYDGSDYELNAWFNSASYLDHFVLKNYYPKTTGHAVFSPGTAWGTLVGSKEEGYGLSNNVEYITVKGGPHVDNVISEINNRGNNLQINGETGNTVEFWLKKNVFDNNKTDKEVIFDLTTISSVSSSAGYGRLTIEITGSNGQFLLTYMSGTNGFWRAPVGNTTAVTGNIWNHFAFNFVNSGNNVKCQVFRDGKHENTIITGSVVNIVSGPMIANIGALKVAAHNINSTGEGWGKLSGSIDEFRFWKQVRTSEQIGRNWFRQVAGGTNTDTSNTTLGLYYKFNEGITDNSNTDSVVLDYSGRINNGTWTGYASTSRNTSSAITDSTKGIERTEPIIRSNHPSVISIKNTLSLSGSAYDDTNNAAIYYSFPRWIREDDTENDRLVLQKLTQIMASYMDTMYLQIEALSSLKHHTFTSASFKPFPFARHLIRSVGMIDPEIFVDSEILEHVASQDNNIEFSEKLYDVKNSIYQNIYNNISYIYKSKGTEKSFRNLIRCFGVDEDVVKFNIYANNETYKISDRYKSQTIKKKYVDHFHTDRINGTVYQKRTADPNTVGMISGSANLAWVPRTFEVEVLLPRHPKLDASTYLESNFISSSIFGCHTANSANEDDLTWGTPDPANFSVYAVRNQLRSKSVSFKLTGSAGYVLPELNSGLFEEEYDNKRWNLAVKIRPSDYPLSDRILDTSGSDTYTVEFCGYNTEVDVIRNSFSVSGTIAKADAQSFLTSSMRMYAGAHRTNFTGSLLQNSDIKISSVRHWLTYLNTEELIAHAFDPYNKGVLHPYENAYQNIDKLTGSFVPRKQTLVLDWDFQQVTGSDASGVFAVTDTTSGSVDNVQDFPWLGPWVDRQHTGEGRFYPASNTDVVDIEYVVAARQNLPESITNLELVNVIPTDEMRFTLESRPINHYFAFEKSMYQTISEEILKCFSTMIGLSTLIGAPVEKYRQKYKMMEKVRQLFFRGIANEPDLEKFVEYYRWIDSALSTMLQQLVPASADVADTIRTIVESHILERNKYFHKYPTLEEKINTLEGVITAINKLLYNWRLGHHPVGNQQNQNRFWWQDRAERDVDVLGAASAAVNTTKKKINDVIASAYNRQQNSIFRLSADVQNNQKEKGAPALNQIGAGLNNITKKVDEYAANKIEFNSSKNIQITASAIRDFRDIKDEEFPKELRKRKLLHVVKQNPIFVGEQVLPFSIISSSADGGYIDIIQANFSQSVDFVGLHHEGYGESKDVGMQGPFTEKFVGGKQRRHIDITHNPTLTGSYNRPEEWYIEFVSSNNVIKLRSPSGVDNTGVSYTDNPSSKYYREEYAKRPVNIRNILMTTSSAGTRVGNFTHNYQIIQTTGRRENNHWLRHNSLSALPGAVQSAFLTSSTDFTLPTRNVSKTTFVNRFSAPGGGDVMSRGFLDSAAEEYAANNALPWRNQIVRKDYNTALQAHSEQFGIRTGSIVSSKHYDVLASTTKQYRNKQQRMVYSDSRNAGLATQSFYNNSFYSSLLPQSDRQYSWIAKSFVTAPVGFMTSSTDLTVITASDFVSYKAGDNRNFGIVKSGPNEGIAYDTEVPTVFTWFNTNIKENVDINANTIGFSDPNDLVRYVNAGENPSFFTPGFIGNERSLINQIFSNESAFGNKWTFAGKEAILNGILLRRNGPYGHPSWKQIRNTDHPILQTLRRKNLISCVDDIKKKSQYIWPLGLHAKTQTFIPTITQYSESAVTNKYNPIAMTIVDEANEIFDALMTHDNELLYFANPELNDKLAIQQKANNKQSMYDKIVLQYKEKTLEGINIKSVSAKERVWPKDQNVGREHIRNRDDALFGVSYWRHGRDNRTVYNQPDTFGTIIASQSMWPLDARLNWETSANTSSLGIGGGEGVLLNNYNIHHGGVKTRARHTPLYVRREVISGNIDTFTPAYDPLWEVGKHAGKYPFYYKNYDDYAQNLRLKAKDHSIIPEFKISDHMETYILNRGGVFKQAKNDYASITASLSLPNSSDSTFVNDYMITDPLEQMVNIFEDFNRSKQKTSLKLHCDAFVQLLPYEGFYPVNRTLDLCVLFSQSYGSQLTTAGADASSEGQKRAFFNPIMGPGILYNTIKSGIAVDYPIFTGSWNKETVGEADQIKVLIGSDFHARVPFEALIEPESKYFFSRYVLNEPHPSAEQNATASWTGDSDKGPLYKLAMHNFLAESTNMFLKDGKYTSFTSLNSGHANFGIVDNTKTAYMMDVRLAQSQVNDQWQIENQLSIMYSAPAAFGPPSAWERPSGSLQATAVYSYYPYTPPYYDFAAAARIKFVPFKTGTDLQKYTLSEILSNLTITYHHIFSPAFVTTGVALRNHMQISASVNLLGTSKLFKTEFDQNGNAIAIKDDNSIEQARWVIEPKYETLVLDFTSGTLNSRGVYPTKPQYAPNDAAVIRGMWHQYGQIPSGSLGLTLEIKDPYGKTTEQDPTIQSFFIDSAASRDQTILNNLTGSLADLVGFSKEVKKIGTPRETFDIGELILAIPFVESNNEKTFFQIPEQTINNARTGTNMEDDAVKQTKRILDLTNQYVFPPQFNFGLYIDIEPITMYAFEFKHTLSKDDLVDMWQNLPPKIAYSFKQHTSVDENIIIDDFIKTNPDDAKKIRFLIFKVKQKASWNYYAKTSDSNDDDRFKFDFAGTGDKKSEPDYNYNWPYDHCSLVESAKITAELNIELLEEEE